MRPEPFSASYSVFNPEPLKRRVLVDAPVSTTQVLTALVQQAVADGELDTKRGSATWSTRCNSDSGRDDVVETDTLPAALESAGLHKMYGSMVLRRQVWVP